MKTIKVRQLAAFSLAIVYARDMGDNKIRHYIISQSSAMLASLAGLQPLDMLRDHLSGEENEEVTVEIIPTSHSGLLALEGSDTAIRSGGRALEVKNVTDMILKDYPEITASLKKTHVASTLHQYNIVNDPLKMKYLTPITKFINRNVVDRINALIRKIRGPVDYWYDPSLSTSENKSKYRRALEKIPMVRSLPEWGYIRAVVPAHFLTVAFEEQDLEEAVASLVNDLKILNDNDLIMGHMSMPSILILADTVGSGRNQFALFCFPFVDLNKLREIKGIDNPLLLPKKPLELLGVKNETFEGGINYLNNVSPHEKYAIEEIYVSFGGVTSDTVRKAVQDNFDANKEYVNKAAKNMSDELKKIEKVESTSETDIVNGKVVLKVSARFEGESEAVERLNKTFEKK